MEHLLESIKLRGYWRINFRPISRDDRLTNLRRCFDLVDRNRLTARGWDYPHIPTRSDDTNGTRRLEASFEAWSNFLDHRELWRMYMSSQFIHLKALHEDWSELDPYSTSVQPPPPVRPRSTLAVMYNTWTFTEIFLFLNRLAENGLYSSGVEVCISLKNTAGRSLRLDDHSRVPLYGDYKTDASSLTYDRELTRLEISEPTERTVDALGYFFDKFAWTPARDQIRQYVDGYFKL